MKELKLNKAAIIVLCILAAIAIGGAIAIAMLPDSYFDSNGEDGATGKIVLCSVLGLFALILAICAFVGNNREKKKIEYINKARESLGDTALIFEGKTVNPKESRKNAKKTAASVAGGVLFAAIFGFGFFRISGSNNARTFIIHDKGICVINRQTMESVNRKIEDLRKMVIELGKNGQVVIRFPNMDYHYVLNTKNTDVTPDWLQNRLTELANKPIEVVESPFE